MVFGYFASYQAIMKAIVDTITAISWFCMSAVNARYGAMVITINFIIVVMFPNGSLFIYIHTIIFIN